MEAPELTTRPTEPTDLAGTPARPDPDWIDDLRALLLRDAFLFDDPRVYRAGVEDALAGVAAELRRPAHRH